MTLEMNNISSQGREIGIKVGNEEEWIYQHNRLKHTFIIEQQLNANVSLVPQIYIDKLNSTATVEITKCSFYIEHLNTQSL